MSTKSAGLAKKLGYTNIKVMLKGVPGWKKTGEHVWASDKFIENGNIILVDLRSESEAQQGHINKAVNIPFDELEDMQDDFQKKAPVVVYGAQSETKQAYKLIRTWGLKEVAVLQGGMDGYLARGHNLVAGAPEIDINWTRKIGKAEVSVEEFLQIVEGKSDDTIILDVRAEEETAEGKFINVVCIPLDELESKLAELPKNKEILLHCTTGARAEMAHSILKKSGLRSRFLVADVECKALGECEIN